ncbi:DEDD exonuclease domain-containing protein [Dermacoccaceae bacterium W4C1]
MNSTAAGVQASFEDLGTPLHEVTFVVVDLETTGGSPASNAITEIGAVKVRGGEVLGEFQTLVRPDRPIPAFIQVLTGITDRMVADAPRIETALPAFLEFARGTVWVAHNAGFDVGFLKAATERQGLAWPTPAVIDTVRLSRRLVTREESPNHKLGSLAQLFGAQTSPDHRALHDAKATVDVLHGLIGRLGTLGVRTLEELLSYNSRVTDAQRRKRFLADDLPSAPGVYVFRDSSDRPLYVGTSVDIKRRARSYFTSSEQRTRMAEMVRIAERITPIVCPTPVEAQVRELRLIAEYKPRYNRRSRHPERAVWVKLTQEAFPRLSVVRTRGSDGAHYIGPFAGKRQALDAVAAVHEVVPIRQCTTRLSRSGNGSACVLAEMGRCGAPCTGEQSLQEYAQVVAQVCTALEQDVEPLVDALEARMAALSHQERFEDAGALRDRLVALVRGVSRAQRLSPLATSAELVAASRADDGGWHLVCVRYGRLAGSAHARRGQDPMTVVASLRSTAEQVTDPGGGLAALPEETELIARWLERPGIRLVHLEGQWTCPVGGAGRARDRLEEALSGAHDQWPTRPATPRTRTTVPG